MTSEVSRDAILILLWIMLVAMGGEGTMWVVWCLSRGVGGVRYALAGVCWYERWQK